MTWPPNSTRKHGAYVMLPIVPESAGVPACLTGAFPAASVIEDIDMLNGGIRRHALIRVRSEKWGVSIDNQVASVAYMKAFRPGCSDTPHHGERAVASTAPTV